MIFTNCLQTLLLCAVVNNSAGDIHTDGKVDLLDFAVLQSAVATCDRDVLADLDHDGCVTVEDFLEWQMVFRGPLLEPPKFGMRMKAIQGGGEGPSYTFEIGEFEVTTEQFVYFLNDAQHDGGWSERGAYLVFDRGGAIRLPNHGGNWLFGTVETFIQYDANAPLGERYSAIEGFERHPFEGAAWALALKFCNWLTIDQGVPVEERCYAEGPAQDYWRSVVGVFDQDLNFGERVDLVTNYRGFRLPMDNVGGAVGCLSNQANEFNEWYKAAAFDPSGPGFARIGASGESIQPLHWQYACGREWAAQADANFNDSGDLYENSGIAIESTPVGYFNGVTMLADQVTPTNENHNAFGVFDMSGNGSEWLQDFSVYGRGVRGGHWSNNQIDIRASCRGGALHYSQRAGLRVLRVP